jgi:hypothetical protein
MAVTDNELEITLEYAFTSTVEALSDSIQARIQLINMHALTPLSDRGVCPASCVNPTLDITTFLTMIGGEKWR